MRKIKLTNNEKILIGSLFFLVIAFAGGGLNSVAISSNGCMPVLNEYNFCDSTHFTYQNPFGIRNWMITDIFPIGNSIYSLGDFLLYFGFLSILLLLWFFYRKFKEDIFV